MRKLLVFLLSLCLIFSMGMLVACGGKDEPSKPTSSNVSSEEISSSITSSTEPEVQTYTISIESKAGGTIMTNVTSAPEGTTVTIFVATNPGYNLVTYLVDGVAQTGNTFVMPAHNVTVSAEFQAQGVAVTYDYNYEGGSYEQVAVNYGQQLGTLPTPTRTGYNLVGWFTAKNGGTQVSATTTVSGTVIYYARWEIKQITATFDANGGTASQTSITKDYNTPIGTLPTATNGKFIFAGWFTAKTGGEEVTAQTLMPANNPTYYAHWEENGLNVLKTAKFRGPNASNVAINANGFTHTHTGTETTSVYLVNDANGELVSASDLRFETEIKITNNNIGDLYPKIGIVVSTSAAPYNIIEGRFIGYYFYLDLNPVKPLGQNGESAYATANMPGTDGGWLSWEGNRTQAISNNYAGEFVKFAVVKEDGVIKFSLNGTLVHTVNTTDVAGNAYVSILGIGCEYQVRNSVCSQIDDAADDPVRVLILGNSLVFFNNLPVVFENVARSAGKNISVSSVTRGSATISDYASRETEHGKKSYDLLESQEFDYIVVEPSRRIVPAQYDTTTFNAELAAARVMKTLAQEVGAELLLYAVWGDQDDIITAYDATNPIAMVKGQSISYPRKEHVKFLQQDVNEYFATQLNLPATSILKAGYAFENYYDSYPTENLYNSDQRHPNLDGTYLTACTFFASIYNETPVGITYTAGSTIASKLQQAAKETVLDGKIPVLVTENADYNVLVVGSGMLNDYNLASFFVELVKEADNKTVYYGNVLDSSFVFNALKEDATDYGLREMLAGKEWDHIVLQISRRTTPNGVGIEASELAALKAIYPILHAETPNIYLMAFNGASNPTKFTTDGGAVNYTSTGTKETLTEAQSNDYYAGLATTWTAEINKLNSAYKCKAYQYGKCYVQIPSADRNKATVGYLQAASLYMMLFGKTYSDSVTCLNSVATSTETITMTEAQAKTLKGYAQSVILA